MMQMFIWVSILVLIMIVLGALIIAAVVLRKSSTEADLANLESHPRGYYISIGMSIGVGFGVALGLVLDNLGLGITLGAGIGMAVGAALEQKNRDKLRPLTEQEGKLQRWGVVVGLLLLVLFAGIFALLLLMRTR
jgi:hypothetical protein